MNDTVSDRGSVFSRLIGKEPKWEFPMLRCDSALLPGAPNRSVPSGISCDPGLESPHDGSHVLVMWAFQEFGLLDTSAVPDGRPLPSSNPHTMLRFTAGGG